VEEKKAHDACDERLKEREDGRTRTPDQRHTAKECGTCEKAWAKACDEQVGHIARLDLQ
jgi:hypothetical protein